MSPMRHLSLMRKNGQFHRKSFARNYQNRLVNLSRWPKVLAQTGAFSYNARLFMFLFTNLLAVTLSLISGFFLPSCLTRLILFEGDEFLFRICILHLHPNKCDVIPLIVLLKRLLVIFWLRNVIFLQGGVWFLTVRPSTTFTSLDFCQQYIIRISAQFNLPWSVCPCTTHSYVSGSHSLADHFLFESQHLVSKSLLAQRWDDSCGVSCKDW